MTGADGTLTEDHVAALVDWMLRILLSYAAVPGDGGRSPTRSGADSPGGCSPPSAR